MAILKTQIQALLCTLALLLALTTSCGENNVFSCPSSVMGAQCEEKSPIEQAKDALDAGDPDLAISLLAAERQKLASDDYSLIPLLASAYAQKAGIDIFGITNVAGQGGGDALSLLNAFVPTPAQYTEEEYQERLAAIGISVELLSGVPDSYKEEAGRESFASSLEFQFSLYSAANAIMILNQFLTPDLEDPSAWDQERLASMSDAEAETIISFLANSAAQDGEGNIMAPRVAQTLASIEASEGETSRDRLITYANRNQ
jgi:hypothetical protein